MKIKLVYNPTERQKDIIGLMQGYLGIIYATGIWVFCFQNRVSMYSIKALTWGLIK